MSAPIKIIFLVIVVVVISTGGFLVLHTAQPQKMSGDLQKETPEKQPEPQQTALLSEELQKNPKETPKQLPGQTKKPQESSKPISAPTRGLPDCPTPTATGCHQISEQRSFDPSGGKCVGTSAVMFGASPFRIDQIELVEPMGQMVGGHVTPIDHGYIFGKGTPDVLPDTFDIQSPAKGYVVSISRTQRGDFSDHAMTIEFSCTLFIQYSNMTSFSARIMAAAGGSVGPNETKNFRVPMEEGELVGRTGAYGIDLYVWDLNKTLTGFVNPASYKYQESKLHSSQFFDYAKEPLKTELLSKTIRQLEPRFGKIDYDIDGRLVGNWFQIGTGGYLGLNRGGEGYWTGHLSIVYDALDPLGIAVSIGNWPGGAAQFGVRGNTPDPKNIGADSGVIKYELLQQDWIDPKTGQRWDRRHFIPDAKYRPTDGVPNAVRGVLLLQMTGPRMLKMETFPGESADHVSGFTENARLYER